MYFRYIVFVLFIAFVNTLQGQILINEVLSMNTSGITDENQEHTDWIELYNSSDESINLEGYFMTDDKDDSLTWSFPNFELAPNSFLLIYASGKDRKTISLNYKTVIDRGDEWQYLVPPNNAIGNNWRMPGYSAGGWQTGTSSFGYGDDDDATVIQPLESIFIRKIFTLENSSEVERIILHVDYDDGFLATINGELVAVENVAIPGNSDFDNATANGGHEAEMYQGRSPSEYEIDLTDITLYNGENVLALQGYNISSGSSDFTLAPYLTIGANYYTSNDFASFVILEDGGLHTDFKVSNDGEGIYLFNAQQEIIDSIWVVELPDNVSYGRYPDGQNSWKYFSAPTPGSVNLNPMEELRNDTIIFSKSAGFYPSLVQLNITSNASDVAIKYTSDGSEPSVNSPSVTGALPITSTRVVRAATFFNGTISSDIYTNSYFINTDHKLPVVALSTDTKHFFDWNEGILVEGPNAVQQNEHLGANYWNDWEKLVHFEYFDEDGIERIGQDAGVKVSGGWSRVNAQKSMALFARSKYGKGSFEHKFFKDRTYDKFEAILLRNSGNDWSYSMLRDGLVSEIAKDLNMERLAFQPTVVYLSGQYWGILNMRDKPNEHYFASLYNIDSDIVNILEVNGYANTGDNLKYSKMLNFINSHELLNEEDYAQVSDVIDEDCFIDYELLQIYVNNRDWPGNNIKFWNTTSPHSKYRWLIYDTDFGLNLFSDYDYQEDGISFATYPYSNEWPNPKWSTLLLRKMLTNTNFKNHFVNRMADLMNLYFLPQTVNSKLDSLIELVDSEMPYHQELWGRSYGSWREKLEPIYTFNNSRPGFVRQHFRDYFGLQRNCNVNLTVSNEAEGQIMVSTITPSVYPFKGIYFSNIPIQFNAKPKPGYQFVRWENASNSTEPEIELTLSGSIVLHAVFEEVVSNDYQVVINEINYRSADEYDSGDWLELYNPTSQTIDLSNWMITGDDTGQEFIFYSGTLLYPNDYLVVYNNETKFKEVYPTVENKTGELPYGLSRKGDVIYLYDSNDNLVDMVMYETRLPWTEEPFSTAATLELVNPQSDNNKYNNWMAGPQGGTPGRRNGTFTTIDNITIESVKASCFPTKFSDFTTLRFNSKGEGEYCVSIMDIQGRVKEKIEGILKDEGIHYLDIFTNASSYANGIYLVQLTTQHSIETVKVTKF
ncbi:MAG: lamin tail domain-containing protein [Prolixibacteraceae bacterium]|jgi:hypothetical protein|nr:lamin tail domain-containing protein [Prolixibacteraceae bacterium]